MKAASSLFAGLMASRTARWVVVLGVVAMTGLVGANALFDRLATTRLERLATRPPAGCRLTHDGSTILRGMGRVRLVLDHPALSCALLAGQDRAGKLIYAASRAELTLSPWAPSGVALRVYGMQILQSGPPQPNAFQSGPPPALRSLLRLEGEPIDVVLPHLTTGAGQGVVQAAFVHVLPFGVILRGLDGHVLWNTDATPQASAVGLALSARQVIIPAGQMPSGQVAFEHVQAAFSMPGPFVVPQAPNAGEERPPIAQSGRPLVWPPLLVQHLSGQWRGVPLALTGHFLGGDVAAPTGDFWLTLRDWKPLAHLLRQQSVVPEPQMDRFEGALDRLASQSGMKAGAVTVPLMLRAGEVRLGTLPLDAVLPALRAASNAAVGNNSTGH
ncbi:DUF2125 domain-containing protein [Acetobacter sp. TBRC 12305]|uniref:DUF2125 domain-containing protein n=1 Tax=Acetobacter garciniae TaxID=2817435 RepID=A0A939HM25_9PROT|nr:DUF2125 domain-containing protein [Acetobacter garciniae]MBO1323782.1 DUF2125 domain-containing protein [Acetobacter garciniae]MBX0343471.1 DUF2125 domain-containing protein [Acetobacter garciniae]